MSLTIWGILASVKNCSIARGLLLRYFMLVSWGFSVCTSMCSVCKSILYLGSSLIEIVDNFSYKVTAFGIVGLTATSSYILPVINSNKDLPSIRLFTTGVAERPR